MTSYANFVREFPKRCKGLLSEYSTDAKSKNLEVTLLIAVATSAFTIPYERLNPSSPDHIADDRHPEAVHALGRLQNRHFVNWQKLNNWMMMEDLNGSYIRSVQADRWAVENNWQPMPSGKKVGTILSILRNALAHGSIYTFPRSTSQREPSQIEDIVFLSRVRDKDDKQLIDKYNAVKGSPEAFKVLIMDWISFLEGLKLPSTIKQENL